MARTRTKPEPQHVGQLPLIAAIGAHLATLGRPNVEVRQLNAIVRAADLIVAAFADPPARATPGMGLAAWLKCDDVGESALAMARILAPFTGSTLMLSYPLRCDHPLDPADLGRCVGLLDAAPELRPHVGCMRVASPTWGRLASRWDELEAMYREELPTGSAPRTYDLMRRIIDGEEMEDTFDGEEMEDA